MLKKILQATTIILGLAVVSTAATKIYVREKERKILEKTVYIECQVRDDEGDLVGVKLGAGALISPNGHILTAAHVVDDCPAATITRYAHQELLGIEILSLNDESDLALLKAPLDNQPYFKRGATPFLGDKVRVVGHPFGHLWTMTTGTVTGVIRNYLQLDASTNPGNSGGPVVDDEGRLVGIISAIVTADGLYAGTGLAVSIQSIDEMIEKYVGIFSYLEG